MIRKDIGLLFKKNIFYILQLLVFLEFTLTLFVNKIPFKSWVSIIYILSGITVGFVFLKSLKLKREINSINNKSINFLYYLIISFVFGYFIYQINIFFINYPLNYKWADMLPIMKIMADRFIHGENPYQKIDEIWGGMEPIYLPAMWIWYVIPTALKIDIRWVNISFMLLGIFLFLYKGRHQINKDDFITLFLVAYFLIESLHHKNQDWYILTEEPLVAGYYLILAYALFKRNFLLIGFSLSLCLLSRYVLLCWFFCYLLYHFDNKTYLKKLIVVVGITCLALFLFSSAYTQIDVFIQTPNGYLQLLLSDKGEGIYNSTIKNSLGIAKFFKLENLRNLHFLSIFCMLFIPIGLFYRYKSARTLPIGNLYAIGILKICLVFFYNLLILPCHYLFITSTLFSIAILSIYSYNGKEV